MNLTLMSEEMAGPIFMQIYMFVCDRWESDTRKWSCLSLTSKGAFEVIHFADGICLFASTINATDAIRTCGNNKVKYIIAIITINCNKTV